MLTETDILDALRDCYASSQGKPVNIVDLGLVHGIELAVDPEAPGAGIAGVPVRQRVKVTLLETGEETGPLTAALASNRLAGMPELSSNEVFAVAEPVWSRERISAAGRRVLQLDFQILNNRRA